MRFLPTALLTLLMTSSARMGRADVVATVERVPPERATAAYQFTTIPGPAGDDLATVARFLIEGEQDLNSAGLAVLHDGRGAASRDDPRGNFFFAPNTTGGRLSLDLGEVQVVGQINTYSWHATTRAPQVYKVYSADGTAAGFAPNPKRDVDPTQVGWTLLTTVDTRPGTIVGGQQGVSVHPSAAGSLGKFRYVLLDVARTEADDPFGNTFFSEIDVVAADKALPIKATDAAILAFPAGDYRIAIDTTGLNAEMTAWARARLQPVCIEWYPRIVALLPSPGYTAPQTFTIVFKADMPANIPAAAGGTQVMCNIPWFERNKDGEAVGAVVHEMVHVVQQYRRRRGGGGSVPNWLQEGIPDYIRWFLYEPQTNGARIRDASRVNYNNSYRISGNFLNWATATYDKDIVAKLNAAIRQGTYNDEMWKDLTGGKTLDQLNTEWKQSLSRR